MTATAATFQTMQAYELGSLGARLAAYNPSMGSQALNFQPVASQQMRVEGGQMKGEIQLEASPEAKAKVAAHEQRNRAANKYDILKNLDPKVAQLQQRGMKREAEMLMRVTGRRPANAALRTMNARTPVKTAPQPATTKVELPKTMTMPVTALQTQKKPERPSFRQRYNQLVQGCVASFDCVA